MEFALKKSNWAVLSQEMTQPDLVWGCGTLPGAISGSGTGEISSWAAEACVCTCVCVCAQLCVRRNVLRERESKSEGIQASGQASDVNEYIVQQYLCTGPCELFSVFCYWIFITTSGEKKKTIRFAEHRGSSYNARCDNMDFTWSVRLTHIVHLLSPYFTNYM